MEGTKRIPVKNADRKVFDAICAQQNRGLMQQFTELLNDFCERNGYDRRTGKKLNSNGSRN